MNKKIISRSFIYGWKMAKLASCKIVYVIMDYSNVCSLNILQLSITVTASWLPKLSSHYCPTNSLLSHKCCHVGWEILKILYFKTCSIILIRSSIRFWFCMFSKSYDVTSGPYFWFIKSLFFKSFILVIKDVKCNSKGSAIDTVESNEETSGSSWVSQRSKQLGYFFEKYIE